jgi:pimeloyl-ACP methyl ester carboxylesterase
MKRPLRIILIVLAGLLLLLGVGPLLVPVPPLEGTLPPKQLADPDSRFVELQGIEVHYKIAGQGDPVLVLLHGFGASIFSWKKVLAPLAQEGTVIAFDRPAFGLTERPMPGDWTEQNPYSPEFSASLVIALLDELGVERAILVGHSAGGTIAVLTALTYPERVEALVLEDPAIYGGGGFPGWIRPLLRSPQLRRIGPLLLRSFPEQGEKTIVQAWHNPSQLAEEDFAGYKKPLQAQNWDRALWELAAAQSALNLPDRLEQIQFPVLVLTGDNDRLVPPENSVRLAEELANAELVIVPECGHIPHEECTQAFLEAVTAFLAGLAQ